MKQSKGLDKVNITLQINEFGVMPGSFLIWILFLAFCGIEVKKALQ